MTHASLFSGIGGFDLAAQQLGWENVFTTEINPFCRKVLAYHFPTTKHYEDIKTTRYGKYKNQIDVLSGGFPCQPFSLVGDKKGTEDQRHLWPEMLRCLREVQPRWVVAENVPGLLAIENGLVFERICTDLETAGYQVQPFVIPAYAVGQNHIRKRLWFIAHAPSLGLQKRQKSNAKIWKKFAPSIGVERLADQPLVPSQDDVFPRGLDGITFPKWRRESIQAFGNAIVVDIAVNIFRAIEKSKQQ